MNRIIFCVYICFFLGLSACSTHRASDTKEASVLPPVSCVAVLPTLASVSDTGALSKTDGRNLEEGSVFLDSVLLEELGDRSEFKVLSENQLDAMLSNPWRGKTRQLKDLGQATGCGAVLEINISRYRHRVGGQMSAETPASVAFSMQLLGVKTGTVLWSTSFDETQKPLFEDIFSFSTAEKRGFKWLSAQELCRDGVDSRLAEFPYFQQEEF